MPSAKPSFSFIPAADRNTGSSRQRAFALADALNELGIIAHIGRERADVVIIQKKLDKPLVAFAEDAKRAGSTIVYDIDDVGKALWWWAPRKLVQEMIGLADVVTTSTAEQAEYLRRDFGETKFEVVPSMIDYDLKEPVDAPTIPASPLRVLWYGSNSNFDLLKKYEKVIVSMPDVKLVVMTDADAVEELAPRRPHVEFQAWSLSRFVPILQSCHLCCLMHDGSPRDRAKSNSRMTTSIAWGVPAVVSDTPDYARTARAAGVADAIFHDESDLPQVIDRFRGASARREFLKKSQPIIWQHFSPHAVAKILLDAVSRNLCHAS